MKGGVYTVISNPYVKSSWVPISVPMTMLGLKMGPIAPNPGIYSITLALYSKL